MAHPPRRRPLNRPAHERLIPDGLDATLVLLRHGESTYIVDGRFQGQADAPLTNHGRRQAAAAAERLAHADRPPGLPIPAGPPLAIVASPLGRTRETAEAVASAVPDAPPSRPEPGLLEVGQGDWEGLPGAEIAERWGDVLAGWRRDPVTTWAPGGESLAAVDARVRIFLSRLLADLVHGRQPGSTNRSQVLGYRDAFADVPWALIVGHDGVFKVVLLALLDLPLDRFWAFPFALAGISIVEIRGGRGRLRAHNLVEHLVGLEHAATEAGAAAERPNGAL